MKQLKKKNIAIETSIKRKNAVKLLALKETWHHLCLHKTQRVLDDCDNNFSWSKRLLLKGSSMATTTTKKKHFSEYSL